jgi:hypothetical protein
MSDQNKIVTKKDIPITSSDVIKVFYKLVSFMEHISVDLNVAMEIAYKEDSDGSLSAVVTVKENR